jgi:hypothetical protein
MYNQKELSTYLRVMAVRYSDSHNQICRRYAQSSRLELRPLLDTLSHSEWYNQASAVDPPAVRGYGLPLLTENRKNQPRCGVPAAI